MKVAVLGSGSRGNATLVWCGNTRLLVDAGFSARDLARRLVSVDVEPDSIDGIIVTHDHGAVSYTHLTLPTILLV